MSEISEVRHVSSARHGDYSSKSYLGIKSSEEGLLVRVMIDQVNIDQTPNPRFCNHSAGGLSLQTFKELVFMFKRYCATDASVALLPSSSLAEGKKSVIRLTRGKDGDVVIGCYFASGEHCEADVLFRSQDPAHESFLALLLALIADSVTDKTHVVILDAQ